MRISRGAVLLLLLMLIVLDMVTGAHAIKIVLDKFLGEGKEEKIDRRRGHATEYRSRPGSPRDHRASGRWIPRHRPLVGHYVRAQRQSI